MIQQLPDFETARSAAERVADSPVPLAVGVIAGVVLLLAGAKLLRVGVVLIGLAAGCWVGASIAGRLAIAPVADLPPQWLGGGVGALAGGLLGFAMFRFAMAVTSAGACAGVGVLAAAMWLQSTQGPLPAFEPRTPEWPSGVVVPTASAQDATQLWGSAETAGRGFADDAAAYWSALPASTQRTLALGALGGALLGLLVGSTAPRRAAALMTGLTGSAIALSCGAVLADRFAPTAVPSLDLRGWLMAWAVLGVLGCIAQVRMDQASRAPRTAPATA